MPKYQKYYFIVLLTAFKKIFISRFFKKLKCFARQSGDVGVEGAGCCMPILSDILAFLTILKHPDYSIKRQITLVIIQVAHSNMILWLDVYHQPVADLIVL